MAPAAAARARTGTFKLALANPAPVEEAAAVDEAAREVVGELEVALLATELAAWLTDEADETTAEEADEATEAADETADEAAAETDEAEAATPVAPEEADEEDPPRQPELPAWTVRDEE